MVLSGADLKNMDPSDVYWAFTGATEKDGDVATVDLGYVRLTVDPRDSGVFAYVVSDADRTYDDGHYIHVGAKIDATGTVYDYTTAKSIIRIASSIKICMPLWKKAASSACCWIMTAIWSV